MSANSSKTTIDHDEIREWVEARGGHPATVKRTEKNGEPGILRIDFPGFSGEDTLEEISWDEFFDKFEESNLAFVYQEAKASGEPSTFSKLVRRPDDMVQKAKSTSGKARKSHAKESHKQEEERAETKGQDVEIEIEVQMNLDEEPPAKQAHGTHTHAKQSHAKQSHAKQTHAEEQEEPQKPAAHAHQGGEDHSSKMTIDHDEIREWTEARGGHPATVKRTEKDGEPGILRIDFPGFSGEGTLEEITWDEFFNKFEESNLAFVYQEAKASGEPSTFSKLVRRPEEMSPKGKSKSSKSKAA